MSADAAQEDRMRADAEMALVIECRGKDKCVRIGCMTEIDPDANEDGFCRFHRKTAGKETTDG